MKVTLRGEGFVLIETIKQEDKITFHDLSKVLIDTENVN